MRLIYDNIIDDLNASTLTALTTATGYSILDVQDERLSTVWKSSNATTQSILVELDTFPEYPDSTAGTTYINTEWATVDGWTSGGAVSVSNGIMRFTKTAPSQSVTKTLTVPAGSTIRIGARHVAGSGTPSSFDLAVGVTGSTVSPTTVALPSDGSWVTHNLLTAGAGTVLFFYLGSLGGAATYAIEFDFIYIGDGTYDTKLPDVSGNGNDATVYGCTPVDGIAGKALSGDGTNDYAEMPCPQHTSFSMACWFKGTAGGDTKGIFTIHKAIGSARALIRITTAGTPRFILVNTGDATSTTLTDTTNVIDDSWHFFVGVYDGTTGYLYVDGTLKDSESCTYSSTYYNLIRLFNYVGTYNPGTIGNPRIYNRALSAAEVLHLYNLEHWNEEAFGLVMQLELDYGLGVNTAALLGHNVATGTTVKVQANNSNEWGSPEVDETMTVNDGAILTFLDSTYYYRYWRFSFTGQGDLEVGRAWLGEYLSVSPSSLLDFRVIKRRSDINIYGINRQKFSVEGVGWRRFEMTFPETDTVMLESIQRFYSAVRQAHSFIFCNFDDVRDYQIVEPCYVSLQEPITYSHGNRMRFTYSLVMEEDR